jgi:5-methylcytosine-specific restriction endonuclease McrA
MILATWTSHSDMTERERFEYQENRIRLMVERGCTCEVCGKHLDCGNLQLAHRIPKRKIYLKQYGKEVIHHPLNLATVCSLKCNDAVLLDPKTHPIEAQELIRKIKDALGK